MKELTFKNIIKVSPMNPIDTKAVAKALISTKYIGFFEGIQKSSTELYAKQIPQHLVNTGSYTKEDVVFVSVIGNRGNVETRRINYNDTLEECILALESGATLVTNNKTYTKLSNYNLGEKFLYRHLMALGYKYSEVIINKFRLGLWEKTNLGALK